MLGFVDQCVFQMFVVYSFTQFEVSIWFLNHFHFHLCIVMGVVYLTILCAPPITMSAPIFPSWWWLHSTAREEPAVSYKWTGWVWETTGWVQDFKIFTDHLEESIEEYTSNEWKHQNRKMSTCNQLDFESLGSCPPTLHMPINFPGTEWYNSYWSTLWILNINV